MAVKSFFLHKRLLFDQYLLNFLTLARLWFQFDFNSKIINLHKFEIEVYPNSYQSYKKRGDPIFLDINKMLM